MSRRGLVTFVTGVVGEPAFRTRRAEDRIAEADDVVGDEVGAEPQARARALTRYASEGKRVVRLLSGDALASAVEAEEVRAVASSGADYEVIPGVGPAAAAATFAGVVAARAVSVRATEVDRVVAGVPDTDAVTVIAGAGGPTQRIVVGTAGSAAAAAHRFGAKYVIVAFGSPEEGLRWFERRPLFGRRVLVTRARDQATGTAAMLRERGAEPVVVPTIAIHPPSDPAPLARALSTLRDGGYDWVVFTSANGVDRTWEALAAGGADARAFGRARLAAIGPATARALGPHGLKADVVAEEYRGEGLAEAMIRALAGAERTTRVLVARAAKARDVLPEALRAAGCAVDVVAAYETRPPPPEAVRALEAALAPGNLDAVLFTSSSTVDHLCDLLGPNAPARLSTVRVASIGPITTASAHARGVRVDVTAPKYTVDGLVDALARSWVSTEGGTPELRKS